MEIKLSESQLILQRNARDVLANECPRTLVRDVERNGGYATDLWRKMADLGWLGLGIAGDQGGADGSLLDQVVLHEELGRALAPTPHLVSTGLAAAIIAALGGPGQQSILLSEIATGERIVTVAYLEPEASWRPTGIQLRAQADGDDFLLNGVKLFVPYADSADTILVVARTSGDGPNGITVFLVDRDTPGVQREKLLTVDGKPDFEVTFDNVRLERDTVLGPVGGAWPGLNAAIGRAAILQGAELIGISQVAFDYAVEFSKTRVQFGRPIAVFQAISHKLANMAIELDSARLVLYEQAWSVDQGGDAAQAAAIGKAITSNASRQVVQRASEVMGGLGFMEVHDFGLFFRRQKAGELNLGDGAFHLGSIEESLAAL